MYNWVEISMIAATIISPIIAIIAIAFSVYSYKKSTKEMNEQKNEMQKHQTIVDNALDSNNQKIILNMCADIAHIRMLIEHIIIEKLSTEEKIRRLEYERTQPNADIKELDFKIQQLSRMLDQINENLDNNIKTYHFTINKVRTMDIGKAVDDFLSRIDPDWDRRNEYYIHNKW